MKTLKSREFDRLARLHRRADYIRQRVEGRNLTTGAESHATAELSALDWAIPILEAYLIKKYTANLDIETLRAIKHEIPAYLYSQLLEARS